MLGAAYAQFGNQFIDAPGGDGYLYYRLGYADQQRSGFGPVHVSAEEADGFARHFKWTARGVVLLTTLVFVAGVIALASLADADQTGSGGNRGAIMIGVGAVLLLVFAGVLTARAWGRPQRVLAGRPIVTPDPFPLD